MIKVITEPKVQIISRQEFIDHPQYPLPPDGDDPTRIGAFAAKGCYDSFGEDGRSCEANQKAILDHRHGSVTEHIVFGLWIEGITRGLSLELNRHRSFAISQRSTRYVAEEESAIVLDPYFAGLYNRYRPQKNGRFYHTRAKMGDNEEEKRVLIDHLNTQLTSIKSYQEQVRKLTELNPNELTGFDLRKWARGKARNVLPHGIETRGTWTNNVRGWRWFIESRSNRHAEPEIRRLASVICVKLKEEAPVYFRDFKNNGIVDGIIEWVPEYSKV